MSYVRLGQVEFLPPVVTVPTTPGAGIVWGLTALLGGWWLFSRIISSGSPAIPRSSRQSIGSSPAVRSRSRPKISAASTGLVADLTSALRNQGLSAREARTLAASAARTHPEDFDAALRLALQRAGGR